MFQDISLAELIVIGLIRQKVTKFVGIFGHGSTQLGNVLRIYEKAGLVKMFNLRHETEAVHAATALNWVCGEKAAVVTSIGPGALQALAGSLVPLSDGVGVWFLLGDETSEDEGPNMQQLPGSEQNGFHRLFSAMGPTYTLHTQMAVGTALKRGLAATDHPLRPSPFFLLMPMNVQGEILSNFNLDELPPPFARSVAAAAQGQGYRAAAEAIARAEKVVVKVGGGAKGAGAELADFLEVSGGVGVHSPLAPGVPPSSHPRNMTVGGSKGSLSGNFAMENADLLVLVGSRCVCQSDCSRTGYPGVKQVVTINADLEGAIHYGRNIPLVGDAAATLGLLTEKLRSLGSMNSAKDAWVHACVEKRKEWDDFRSQRYAAPPLYDPAWGKSVLTQPLALKTALDWAREHNAKTFFDAGDVQANGFQILEDEEPGMTFTETGASYMGFASSALMASAMADTGFYGLALTGDGSFLMNPQILVDGVRHGVTGTILVLDNRRMGAISGLQEAQYGEAYATWDHVAVDYVAMARSIEGVAGFYGGETVAELQAALDQSFKHMGLSLIHVPVYYGPDPLGGMGVFGRWNVGNWCRETQALRHRIGL
ncbi:MAG: thiamine pyrophosphate-dependent enzyme [Desulfobacterales bacterium]|nr:thiamine pyrophosphate-dependent enzyme [Desulfobacterales bacterium]